MTYPGESGPVEALREIAFTVGQGELVAVVGPSGCGKSTLLRIIAGLRAPTRGRVLIDGHPVSRPVAEVGMVFQAPVLLKWRRILDNVLLPAELSGQETARYRARARDLLRLVGLEDFAAKLPAELSGGMQQRASLCRALLLDPPLLLMDEPFGALDAMTRDELDMELLRIWEERKKTVLFVTHSIQEAVFLSDLVFVMSARPGRLIETISIDLPRPRTMEMMSAVKFGEYTLKIRSLLASAGGANATPSGSTM